MIDQPLENNIPDEASINPCLVSLQMQLDAANKRIAGLECKVMEYEIALSATDDIRDLEQQAKGLTDYAKEQEQGLNAVWMIAAASKLIEQAKELQEKE
jgi:hypothetical protein